MSVLLHNAHVVVMDDEGSEYDDGWVLIANGRIESVGGSIPPDAAERVDLGGAVVTPGLVNTHHHLYQTLTRARAQEADLFTWLRELYPVWAGIDEESVYAAARTGLAELALSGCTTVFDHHYVFPRGTSGLIEAEVRAARELGVRIVASRGSMDLGESDGGLPPDALVEELDDVLAETERLAGAPGRRRLGADRGRAVLAVLGDGAADARVGGARAAARHEAAHASRRDGRGGRVLPRALRLPAGRVPARARLDRLGRVVRALRPPERRGHPDLRPRRRRRRALPDVEHAARRGHRARARARSPPESDVGLGVDGSASNERGDLLFEVKQALLVARARGGPAAMTARDALRLGTRGGAAVLGRDDIGSLEPGKRADIAVWRTDSAGAGGGAGPGPGACPFRPAPGRPALRRRRGGRARRPSRPRRRGGDRAAPSGPGGKIRSVISTHVLDTARGAPAADVLVELFRGDELVASRRTDADGRIRDLADVEPGVYRLVFHPPSPFFRRVELELDLEGGDYHVPLLVSPFGCATYRGS